jgi:O-antigen ligase
MPLVAAWLVRRTRSQGSERLGWIALIVAIYAILMLGLGTSVSRAGLVLAMLAVLASVVLAWHGRDSDRRRGSTRRVVFAAGLLGICVMLQFGLASLLGRLERDPLEEGRLVFAQVTLRAAANVFPFGSGIGTFVPFYGMFEAPADIGPYYANHAHNDWLELWLEAGVPGMILALLFLAWFASATYRAWRSRGTDLDGLLARAASISALLLMAHSLVDYPLRTTALACVFAFACALIATERDNAKAKKTIPTKLSRERSGRGYDSAYKKHGVFRGNMLSVSARVADRAKDFRMK